MLRGHAGIGGSFQRQRHATGEGGRDVFGGRLGRRWKGEHDPFGFNIIRYMCFLRPPLQVVLEPALLHVIRP